MSDTRFECPRCHINDGRWCAPDCDKPKEVEKPTGPIVGGDANPLNWSMEQKRAFERKRLYDALNNSRPNWKGENEGKAILQLAFEEIVRLEEWMRAVVKVVKTPP